MKIIRSPPFVVIENLPKDIVITILACLPLRDAVRTSILSKKWRYRWTNLVKLVFDDTMCPESTENRQSGKNKLVSAIYQVLLLHQGPVLEFSLSTSELDNCSVIDQVILFLARTGVEKFTLHIGSGKRYKLPSSFFSYPRLTHLNLRSCVVEPPPTFQGFSQLISLKFDEVVIAADLFGRFISSCPLLERLTLTGSDCYHYFEIREFLDLRKCICFEFAPLLSNVSVALKQPVPKEYLKEEETFNFIKLFGGLPLLQNLRMDYYLIKSLAAGGVPKKLPTNLAHLKILEFSLICFSELDEVSCALCLIRSSPNLQKLSIQMFEAKDAAPILEFLQAQDYSDVILDRLQIVKVKHISGMLAELEFIKLLLAKTPRLETLLIKPKSENANDKLKMLQTLTRFRRASPVAEIIIEDPV